MTQEEGFSKKFLEVTGLHWPTEQERYDYFLNVAKVHEVEMPRDNVLRKLPVVENIDQIKENMVLWPIDYLNLFSNELFIVESFTKTRTQAHIIRVNYDLEIARTKLTKSQFNKFAVLSQEGLNFFSNITYRDVIVEAHKRGLNVAPIIRVKFPDVFVTPPERFTVERMKTFLEPQWGNVKNVEHVDSCIDVSQKRLIQLHESQMDSGNPEAYEHFEKALKTFSNDVEFYAWVRPLVDKGGIFYVE